MPSCCAFGCSNNEKKGFKLHRLPAGERNRHRRNIWLLRIARDKWNPTENYRLCEAHFTSDQFENNRADKRRLLKQNAVPSIFNHFQHSAKVCQTFKVEAKESFDNIPPKNVRGVATQDEQIKTITEHVKESSLTNTPVFINVPSVSENSKEIEILKSKINLLQEKSCKFQQENENLEKQFSVLFSVDQIAGIKNGFSKGNVWSDETIQKAVKTYLACGSKGYNYLRHIGFPLPSLRTIQRRMKNFAPKPGISRELLFKITSLLSEE